MSATPLEIPAASAPAPAPRRRMTASLAEIVEIAAALGGAGSREKIAEVCLDAATRQHSVIDALLDAKIVDEAAFLQSLATHLYIPWWGDILPPIPAPLREKIPVRLAVQHRLFPVQEDDGPLKLLTHDPYNRIARQSLAQALGEPVQWVLASRTKIEEGLRQSYGVGAEIFDMILEGRDIDEALSNLKQETTVLDAEDSEASVVRFVNQIIREALRERATDIHIEPLEDDLRIRYRVDGVLHATPVPTQIRLLQDSVISRLKIMAHLDIAERRLPQDGRINLELEGRPIDVRVATIPSVLGESVSLRLLGQEQFNFERLQLEPETLAIVERLLKQPNGIVLVTGPTGSGKSTTLYTCLSTINTQARRIVTIEDPVEYKLPGVIQIAVKPEIGLTFATGLRSILRGDPNVVMIGEMRDVETAEIAIRASLTGHLVFSTLHTNDSIGGIVRLVDMGIDPYLVSSSVRAFLAQRLVRVLCPRCKKPAEESVAKLAEIGYPAHAGGTIFKSVGCEACRRTGYQGRMALLEICEISPAIQDLITQRKSANVLRAKATEEGMISLRQYGWRQVAAGKTTIEEVLRVTSADAALADE
ncbi:general secretion pathway protein E/type IV pilus assembly protein PilB [Verrucomicrobium sp. GAS474]|uniref:GspE/PulE family protein n=1 Tax=Verrucomicrobium sp. GAS474 TaxID=1882831 RepID=UPI00087DDE5B|nr:GspE/PulE family protein [Verrucomicrobium sp. GAS474]SDU06515.1 general secretion pathway protein E/type IV pilus assembly protein PilB [Verrucomicrobium sp. GAS474]